MADDAPERAHGADDPELTVGSPVGDVIDFGELKPLTANGSDDAVPPRRRWIRWAAIAAAALVAASVAVHLSSGDGDHRSVANPTPPPAVTVSPDGGPAEPPSLEPVYYETPTPILGITSAWELFGFGTSRDGSAPEVIRIQFGDGGVTRTPLPSLASGGPVTFAAGRGWAVVRPLDHVPGYLVRSRTAATPLASALKQANMVLPGPANTMWAVLDDDRTGGTHLIRVDADGRATGPRIDLPPTLSGDPQPDRAGNVLVHSPDGTYAATPAGLRRITTGAVLAAGPATWLTLECDDAYRCALRVIDRASNAKRSLQAVPAERFASQSNPFGAIGDVSPDGRHALVVEDAGIAAKSYHLIDLTTGDDRQLSVPLGGAADPGMAVFSPDSRWAFVAGGDGSVNAVDTATGAARSIGVNLPPIDQLAIVDASGDAEG